MSIIADYVQHKWSQPIVEIPGVGRDDLALYFAEAGFTNGVEVGTEYGEYAEVLANALGCDFTRPVLTCVDPYEAYSDYREHLSQLKLDSMFTQARERLMPLGVKFIRERSVNGAQWFDKESLDFVYLDGNHSLPYVIADLHAWVPKVRKGGIIAGHDYIRRNNRLRYQCHVVEAVHAYVESYMIQPLFIVGAKVEQEGVKRDAIRSFFWVKE